MSNVSDSELNELLAKLKTTLNQFPKGTNNLEYELESAAKHIPAYLKVVKSHIEQLRQVLELESHNRRNLDSIEFAKPVRQLMSIFQKLQDGDIELLEELASCALNWNLHASEEMQDTEAMMSETTS